MIGRVRVESEDATGRKTAKAVLLESERTLFGLEARKLGLVI
jgi:hypothetical protein